MEKCLSLDRKVQETSRQMILFEKREIRRRMHFFGTSGMRYVDCSAYGNAAIGSTSLRVVEFALASKY